MRLKTNSKVNTSYLRLRVLIQLYEKWNKGEIGSRYLNSLNTKLTFIKYKIKDTDHCIEMIYMILW